MEGGTWVIIGQADDERGVKGQQNSHRHLVGMHVIIMYNNMAHKFPLWKLMNYAGTFTLYRSEKAFFE